MKKTVLMILSLAFAISASAWDASCPKREFRATWFQTLDRADFPSVGAGVDNSTTAKQKQQIDNFFSTSGHFNKGNLNVAFFQARPMCDAFYHSSFPEEPWSVYLTGKRGQEPQYDPLAYAVEKAHEAGVLIYAWLNPYRFATAYRMNDTIATDYTRTHPDWVVKCSLGSDPLWILNPSNPEVRQRVVDVVMDIVNHYDIDGVVFDDYFYQSGYLDAYDNTFYQQNNPNGLSRGDWRREQINLMVKEVSESIRAAKPWVHFGIGPAGVACTDQNVANQYGISACPSGSDWQYNGIYSDPVNWLYNQYIEYIAPQVYWTIGHVNSDYGKIAPWWIDVAQKFGRHAYISQSLSDYMKDGKNASEIFTEINLNRTTCQNEAPGYVFFPTLPLINTMNVSTLTKAGKPFEFKCLPPARTWMPAEMQGMVSNLAVVGSTLTWSYSSENVKYAIYIIPSAERATADLTSPKYLKQITFSRSYVLPSGVSASTHAIAVSVVDRYNNEYAPRFVGETEKAAVKPTLVSPANHAQTVMPSALRWNAVPEAINYTVQVAKDAAFKDIIVNAQADDVVLPMQKYAALCNGNGTYYWRVAASAANTPYQWSETRSFVGVPFVISYPASGETAVSVNPAFEWTAVDADTQYKLEIATSAGFKTNDIVYSRTHSSNTLTIETNELLYNKMYYARVTATNPNMSFTSPVITFVTENIEMPVPEIESPVNGSIQEAAAVYITVKQSPNNGFLFQLATSDNFPPRSLKKVLGARDQVVAMFENMSEGVWYARVAAQKASAEYTDFSQVVCFTYKIGTGVENVHTIPSQGTKVLTPDGLLIYKDNRVYNLFGFTIR